MYYFEEFTVDPDRRELRRGQELLHLHPRAYDTLLYLLRHPGRVLGKEELLQEIWTDVAVGDNTLAQSIREIREVLDDHVQSPRFIRTVPRKGYLFLPEVREEAPEVHGEAPEPHPGEEPAPIPEAPAPLQPAPSRSRRPALLLAVLATVLVAGGAFWWRRSAQAHRSTLNPVAVLSFKVVGAHDQWQWLNRGLVDMVTTDLAQDSQLHLISYARVLDGLRQHPQNDADSLQLARSVGARTAITGTFVVTGNRFQLDLQATRVNDGEVISSFQTRGNTTDEILSAVDDVCSQLRQKLTNAPVSGEAAAGIFPTHSLAAYQQYLAGLDDSADGTRDSLARAGQEFQKALSIDAGFALAAIHLSQVIQLEKRWDLPVTAQPVSLPPSSSLRPPIRLLVEARLHPEVSLAQRLQDLQELVSRYPDFSLEEGVPNDLVDTIWQSGEIDAALRTGLRYAADTKYAAFYRFNLYDDLGRIYESRGQFREAIRMLTDSSQLRHDHSGQAFLHHQCWLARIYLGDGQISRALQMFDQLRTPAISSNNGLLLTDLAWGYYSAGRKQDSRQMVAFALKANPRWWNAWHLQAWLDLTSHRPAQAAAEFARAYRFSPNQDVPSLYYEGVAQLQAGQMAAAQRTFLLLKQSTPAGSWGTAVITHQNDAMRLIALSLADAQLGDAAPAHAEARQAWREAQGNAEEMYGCAEAFAVLHDRQSALTALRAALQAGYLDLQHIRDNPAFQGSLRAAVLAMLPAKPVARS